LLSIQYKRCLYKKSLKELLTYKTSQQKVPLMDNRQNQVLSLRCKFKINLEIDQVIVEDQTGTKAINMEMEV